MPRGLRPVIPKISPQRLPFRNMVIEKKISQFQEKVDAFSKELSLSVLNEGNPISLAVQGMSMYPFIKHGDRVEIAPINTGEITIGDIVAVQKHDRYGKRIFIHRVVKIVGDKDNVLYVTKGDNLRKKLDAPITTESIVGRITQIKRKNLTLQLNRPFWRYVNTLIATLSLRDKPLLNFLSKYMAVTVEWRTFFPKIKNRLRDSILQRTKELLLLCARNTIDERQRKRAFALISEGVNWDHFCKIAIRGEIAMLVHNTLKTLASETGIPQSVLEKVRPYYFYRYTASRADAHHKTLMDILGLFSEEKILAVPLKGTLLAKRLYGDVARRGISADFDVLVREGDKERARNLLENIGYRFAVTDDVEEWRWQYTFFKPHATPIDLHWDITMMGRVSERIEGLWRGTRLVREGVFEYREFEDEELLLYLATHLINSSRFKQLRYVCDINELLHTKRNRLDWDSVAEKARRWRVSGSLYAALALSKDVFDSPVPRTALKKLKPHFLTFLLVKIFVNKRVILRDCLRRRLINGFFSYVFFELMEARSLNEYWAIFKRVFSPPKEAMKNRSYVPRIFKGLSKFLRRAVV